MKLNVKTLEHFEGLELPAYQTAGSAGLDLPAAVPADAPVVIAPGEWKLIPTGICIALPEGYEAQIRPRSGLAAKKGISCVNTPGTVDADYRGELRVNLINHGKEPFVVQRGERIAQMVIGQFTQISWNPVDALDETARGQGGFGSTGV
ncbi:MAG: dUTP diphosphatase [Oceanicaulis sp.]|jgi:dUTP pyrophosphatase|uniref:dUTP diphosphatase n=1 Tax=unclassified Oceanicaulis TaxID=2632123 RepID=UPI000C603384|nr:MULTISPECIES: dUTP diphosphatase [unclassified Oceanicaulis]MAB69150.1 dUTP diphosphatase [Oceanicaulis sp.]MBC38807.1 dUTP diphosphatase [Oceanicaulis sp.]MBG36225.1 dUTP diphosphatase [Oceanicaulis sp.]HBU61382.1 dUTP diphosphatase [Oceanicaulis sp.]HCR95763.1 dUTP diphosphatase [Oceanicaulis sp.]|tara:strand:- start:3846 stop:4292 length:447 start_codon:yes stop_codon:yes gene_type:complete